MPPSARARISGHEVKESLWMALAAWEQAVHRRSLPVERLYRVRVDLLE
ncbi:hypothetical protein ACI1P2_10340 [Paenibacillus sp. p-8]